MITLLFGCCVQPNFDKYEKLIKRIKKNEGFIKKAYLDSLGHKTIGYGHLILLSEKNLLSGTFSKKFLLDLFHKDFNKAVKAYDNAYKKHKYPQNIEEALIEMIYQLGIKKQKKFTKMNNFIIKKNFFMAALEMKKSLWYYQTPKRVNGLINIFLKKFYE